VRGLDAKRGETGRGRRRKRSRPAPIEQRVLLTAVLCLLALGAVMVYSASSATSLLLGESDGTMYLIRYVVLGAIGLVVMQLLARRGLAAARRLTPFLLGISFLLVIAVKVPGVGIEVNGAQRWLGVGPVQFQPAELLKISLVLYAAGLIADRPRRVRTFKGLVNPLLVVVGGACALVALQPDLGTALVIAFTMGALLVVAGVPLRYLAAIGAGAAVLILAYSAIEPYRMARLTAFIDPWADATGTGFQSVQGEIAIGSGGLLGLGPGQSVQKVFYLPEAHTDFILAVLGEELGFMGIAALLSLYGMIAFAGLRAARRAPNVYAKLVAAGLTSLLVCQAILNVFTVLGIAPLTGVPLPLISYGSTNLIVVLASMGLLLNIASGRERHLRAVDRGRRGGARGGRRTSDADRDRRRRDRRARRTGAHRRRRAAS
jgi:cell division protein FtsW